MWSIFQLRNFFPVIPRKICPDWKIFREIERDGGDGGDGGDGTSGQGAVGRGASERRATGGGTSGQGGVGRGARRSGPGEDGEGHAGDKYRDASASAAGQAHPRRLAEEADADGHARHRDDRRDQRQRDQRPASLVGGLREQDVRDAGHDHGVGRPGRHDGGHAVADDMSERHSHDRRARVAGARRHRQQDRPAVPGRAQPGQGQRRRGAPEDDRRDQGQAWQAMALAVGMATRRGQEEECGDAGDHGQRGRRRRRVQPPSRPDLHEHDGDDELGRDQHLHGVQRPAPQRDRVHREPGELRGEAEQPQRIARQVPEQRELARRLLRHALRLTLLNRRRRTVQAGGRQAGRDHHHHVVNARRDAARPT